MILYKMAQKSDALRKALILLSIIMPVRPLVGPIRASVEVSARCNFKCLMCAYYSPLSDKDESVDTGFMDIALATRVAESAAKMGVKLVSFTGRGEPLLHPNFPSIVRLVRNQGLQSEVFTNGSLLTPKRIEELVDAGLNTLAVSLVGATEKSYAHFHPGKPVETFSRVLSSLALLQRVKAKMGRREPRLNLRFIAMSGSESEVDKMIDLGTALGADYIHLAPLRNRSVGNIGSIALNQDEEKLVLDRLRELTPKAAQAGLRTNLDELAVFNRFGPVSHLFPCYAGWFDFRVLVDGTVDYCVRCKKIMGNANDRPIDEIWLDRQLMELRDFAKRPHERSKLGECDCDRCCHFYSNYRIARFLSALRLAPTVEGIGNEGILLQGKSLNA